MAEPTKTASEHATEALVLAAQKGDHAAFSRLIADMLPLVRRQSAKYKSILLDSDDLLQEGLLGLMTAVRTYRPGGEASFPTYARVCVNNRIRSNDGAVEVNGSKVNFGITLQPNLFFMPMEDKSMVGETQLNLFDGPYYKKISSFRTPSRTMAIGEYFSTGWDTDPTVVAWVKYVEMHEPSGLLLINAKLAATHDGIAKNMLYIGGNASKFRLSPNRSEVATKELWGTKNNI